VPVYAAVLRVKDALRGESKKLAWPVVSVGSVSAGGAGKTPVVIALAKLLQSRGWTVDVLSRGYGREGAGIDCVDLEKVDAARTFGDEPVLMAQAGMKVWVGVDRYAVGVATERAVGGEGEIGGGAKTPISKSERSGAPASVATMSEKQVLRDAQDDNSGVGDDSHKRVHLLDDGFQHRRLGREIDIALVTEEDLTDVLLPAGNLRERLEALRRADVVVIREEERESVEARVGKLMRAGALLWSVHRKLRFLAPLGVLSAGLRPVAFCAIARPEGFARGLQEAGCGIIETVAFNDHLPYTAKEMEQLVAIAKRLEASGFVTTEKDAVKLSPALRAQLEVAGPVVVVGLEAEFVYPERVARELEARLG
jgi:tetraacyldisaccharide 4'-kinase